MKCHYEVLSVARTADENEIKTAYKKLALKWHPDKNLEDTENAKEQFQLVQQAYEVLSDKQERAWYDKHREQILSRSNGPTEDNCLDVYQFFTSSCFKGFGDDENGFYTVYRNIFEKISQEDLGFIEDKNEFSSIPSFGFSNSTYEDVVGPFYFYWTSYSTKKSYTWLDPYEIDNARGRRLLKLIEKENKKVRQKAKMERNEEVRALVAFVKKRDKRMQQYLKQLEAKNLENRQKQEELSKRKRLERKKELNDSSGNQADWTKFDNVKNELEEIEKNLAQEFGNESCSENSDDDNLYCVACNKVFKTTKAFANHESSKKHKENVAKLKATMQEEDGIISEEVETRDNSSGNNSDVDEGLDCLNDTKQCKKKKKKKNMNKSCQEKVEEVDESFLVVDSDNDFDFASSKKANKRKTKKAAPKQKQDEVAGNETKESRVSEVDKNSNSTPDVITNSNADNLTCVTCKSIFPSKNKLFNHLKKSGHSVFIPQTVNVNVKKNKTK